MGFTGTLCPDIIRIAKAGRGYGHTDTKEKIKNMGSYNLFEGSCESILPTIGNEEIDAIVTDPPSGIGFMGKDWDKNRGGRDAWIAWMEGIAKECMRVLKPGGHAFVWALPRTSHWTATAWENANFEVRDILMYIFASGFPKSLDISKAIDQHLGVEREKVRIDITKVKNPKAIGSGKGGRGDRDGHRPFIEEARKRGYHEIDSPIPQSDEAKHFAGWGTGLKPCAEHWILLRKPFKGSVTANILEHGTGALNINGCRLSPRGKADTMGAKSTSNTYGKIEVESGKIYSADLGRYPGNVVHDGSSPVEMALTAQGFSPCFFYSAKPSVSERDLGLADMPKEQNENWPQSMDGEDTPGAFPRTNTHPTVKSVALMRYLARLITPMGGVVLDPFMGSGTTGMACAYEGFDFIGIEQDQGYFNIAQKRIKYAYVNNGYTKDSFLGGLFDGEEI